MDEKEILSQSEEKSFVFSSLSTVFIVLLVIALALFVGKIFFGTRSLEVLLKLNKQEEHLKSVIRKKENENADLQKKLFEYQLTVPDTIDE